MNDFQALFGLKGTEIKHTCLLMPFLNRDVLNNIGLKNFSKGKLYSSGNTEFFTLIRTGVGAALVGDAVLYLKRTKCRQVILFGSCGLTKSRRDMGIGSLVVVSKSYSLESFSDLLLKESKAGKFFRADEIFCNDFLSFNKTEDIKKVTCATLGSLKLEEEKAKLFDQKAIDVVDMESSSFYCAAEYIKRKAMAFLYISDIIKDKPFYRPLNEKDKKLLSSSLETALDILCRFASDGSVRNTY